MKTNEIIEKYWTALNLRDWDSFQSLIDENVTYILPQTREMINGVKAFKEFNETYPGIWTISLIKIIAQKNQGTSKIIFKDENGEQVAISFFELKDNKIIKIEEFWPVSYEPPKRNTSSIKRY